MANEKRPPVKLYYRIGEVSEIVGVEPHVLRYWETEFRTIRPQKSRKGQRIYSRRDVDKLLRVKDLLYNQGYTIAGARKRLRDGVASTEAVAEEAQPQVSPPAPVADSGMLDQLRSIRGEVVGLLRELGEDVR
ncbi:MAG: MerR family transcriptional regulator [Polyangiaceae bacterium]|nr:MerR family transcriptional regulator [Myxococcales bacterium]MCB9588718.1 MerR family transcriptional regulator [Polyangiaceae bacterium]MCB9605276.1 MerR family transcriptional regulator [Polyangiaceae bacterium]